MNVSFLLQRPRGRQPLLTCPKSLIVHADLPTIRQLDNYAVRRHANTNRAVTRSEMP